MQEPNALRVEGFRFRVQRFWNSNIRKPFDVYLTCGVLLGHLPKGVGHPELSGVESS